MRVYGMSIWILNGCDKLTIEFIYIALECDPDRQEAPLSKFIKCVCVCVRVQANLISYATQSHKQITARRRFLSFVSPLLHQIVI